MSPLKGSSSEDGWPATPSASRNEFDGWRSITVSLYMCLVGYGVLVGIPVISKAWVELLGFTEQQVGRVAGADLGGLSAGAVLAALLVRRVNRRLLVFLGLGLAAAANAWCIGSRDYDTVLWLRLAAGVGGGAYTAVAVATLGAGSRPARAYTLMMLAFAFSQAGEMQVLPRLPIEGIYLVFIVGYLATVPFLRWIPPHPARREDKGREPEAASGGNRAGRTVAARILPWFCLLAIVFSYINIGAYWTYIELAALDAGVAESWIVPVLTWVSVGSVLGCLLAMMIPERFGLSRPLLISLGAMIVVVGILGGEIDRRNLLVSLLFFNLLWVFIDVYQMSTAAVIDRTGAFAALLPAGQGLGQIVGPNVAASMLGAGSGYGRVFLMCATAAALALLFYLIMYVFLRRSVPELGGTSGFVGDGRAGSRPEL